MRQLTTAEVRLDEGKAKFQRYEAGNPTLRRPTERVAIDFHCGTPC
jgi:hypothetical protein